MSGDKGFDRFHGIYCIKEQGGGPIRETFLWLGLFKVDMLTGLISR